GGKVEEGMGLVKFGWRAPVSAGEAENSPKRPALLQIPLRESGADAERSTMDKLQNALESAGVEFTNGDQPGVRLAKTAEAQFAEPAGTSRQTAKAVRGKTGENVKKKR